jgi:hypothetical protein
LPFYQCPIGLTKTYLFIRFKRGKRGFSRKEDAMKKNALCLFWFGLILLNFACGDGGTPDESDDAEMENVEDETPDLGTDALPDSEDDEPTDVFLPDENSEDSSAEDELSDNEADFADILPETEAADGRDEAESADVEDETEVTCECTSGDCCDGCHYRSSIYNCRSSSTRYSCSGSGCGSDVIRTTCNATYCTGSSRTCPSATCSSTMTSCSSSEQCSPSSGTCVSCSSCTPSPEVCDNIDNDCDTHIDEEIARACDDAPACPPGLGRQACVAGSWTTCVCVE